VYFYCLVVACSYTCILSSFTVILSSISYVFLSALIRVSVAVTNPVSRADSFSIAMRSQRS
jgi:hypothetical protein